MAPFLSFPIHDWQFWVATAVVIGAVITLAKPFFGSKRSGGCEDCSAGEEFPPRS